MSLTNWFNFAEQQKTKIHLLFKQVDESISVISINCVDWFSLHLKFVIFYQGVQFVHLNFLKCYKMRNHLLNLYTNIISELYYFELFNYCFLTQIHNHCVVLCFLPIRCGNAHMSNSTAACSVNLCRAYLCMC